MCDFMEGQPFDYFNNLPQYQKDLQARTAGLAGQQLGQPNTPMPEEMYKAVMQAFGVPNTSYYGMDIMNSMMGKGPVNTSPFSTFQPTGQTLDYSWDSSDGSGTGSGRRINPNDGSWPTYNFDSGVGVDLIVDDDGNPIYRNRFNPTRNG